MNDHGSAPPRGRPRQPETDRRILEAALLLLGRDGYARMSLDAVAAAAGVTKPTIYRRFRNKAALAEAALARLGASRDDSRPAETGRLRDDLIAQLRHFRHGVSRPYGIALVGTVLAEEVETPELLALYRDQIVRPRRQMVRQVLAEAVARGEIRADVEIDLVVHALIGAYYAQYLAGVEFADDWDERMVDTVLGGLG